MPRVSVMHWLYYQWFVYWWPSDKGNGPENIQWTALAILFTVILYPPIRHAFKREFEKIHHKIDHVMSGGTIENYVEPEWEKFEHFLLVPFKKLINLFKKKK
jgi:hypothetical protein